MQICLNGRSCAAVDACISPCHDVTIQNPPNALINIQSVVLQLRQPGGAFLRFSPKNCTLYASSIPGSASNAMVRVSHVMLNAQLSLGDWHPGENLSSSSVGVSQSCTKNHARVDRFCFTCFTRALHVTGWCLSEGTCSWMIHPYLAFGREPGGCNNDLPCGRERSTFRQQAFLFALPPPPDSRSASHFFFARVEALCVQVLRKSP